MPSPQDRYDSRYVLANAELRDLWRAAMGPPPSRTVTPADDARVFPACRVECPGWGLARPGRRAR